MTSADLRAWQARMGYTHAKAAKALGVATCTYSDWVMGKSRTSGKPVKVDHRTMLACAALEAGIKLPEGLPCS